ncbi:hypothetical protein [Herbaspirillum sp. YR522]|uniref:hypothetical protein n=1 Tax=Herbaspirillum sp. YR522 TaxID=1144342 RepID=UPI00058BB7EE|nr:hypothetical protein [Herbaspirillum sp. YR522]
MEKGFSRLESALLVLIVASGFCPVFIQILEVTKDIPKDKMGDYATWFSGAGTIVAVFTAYLVGERQANAARKQSEAQERKRHGEQIASIFAILESCETEINRLADEYERNAGGRLALALSFEEPIFNALLNALMGINLATLGTHIAITQMVLAQQALFRLGEAIDEYCSDRGETIIYTDGQPAIYPEPLRLKPWKNAFMGAHQKLRAALTARLE